MDQSRQSPSYNIGVDLELVPLKDCLDFFKRGLEFRMFRVDGSFKRGELTISPDQLSLMARKVPDGEFKSKYILFIKMINQQRFCYTAGTKLWEVSVFNKVSIFASQPDPARCFTLRVDGSDCR